MFLTCSVSFPRLYTPQLNSKKRTYHSLRLQCFYGSSTLLTNQCFPQAKDDINIEYEPYLCYKKRSTHSRFHRTNQHHMTNLITTLQIIPRNKVTGEVTSNRQNILIWIPIYTRTCTSPGPDSKLQLSTRPIIQLTKMSQIDAADDFDSRTSSNLTSSFKLTHESLRI